MKKNFSTITYSSFDEALDKLMIEMKKEGFGNLREMSPKNDMPAKPEPSSTRHKMFYATNPQFAYEALMAESERRKLLPVNIMIQEKTGGEIEIQAVDPLEAMQTNGNFNLKVVAELLHLKLQCVLDNI